MVISNLVPRVSLLCFLEKRDPGNEVRKSLVCIAIPKLFATTSKIAQDKDNLEPVEVLIDAKENVSYIICRLIIETIVV